MAKTDRREGMEAMGTKGTGVLKGQAEAARKEATVRKERVDWTAHKAMKESTARKE